MKHNITTLKKEVPKHIRLEVYKEALERKDWAKDQGLCVKLPKILLNIPEHRFLADEIDSESKGYMSFLDSQIAFPELTIKVIRDISNSLYPEPKRIKYLEQWIKELEGRNEQNNTEKFAQ